MKILSIDQLWVFDEAVEPKAHKFIQNILVKLSYLGNDSSWHFDFIFLIIKDSPRTGGIIIACSLPQNWRIPPDLGKFCIVKISFLKFSKIFSFILQKINLVPHSSIIKECSWVIISLQHYFWMRKCTSKKRHFPRSGGFPQNQNFSFPQIWGNFPRSEAEFLIIAFMLNPVL